MTRSSVTGLASPVPVPDGARPLGADHARAHGGEGRAPDAEERAVGGEGLGEEDLGAPAARGLLLPFFGLHGERPDGVVGGELLPDPEARVRDRPDPPPPGGSRLEGLREGSCARTFPSSVTALG